MEIKCPCGDGCDEPVLEREMRAVGTCTCTMGMHVEYILWIGKFVARKFSSITFNAEIKPTKYFLARINRVTLYCGVVIAMKIKPDDNLTNKIFY